MGKARKVEEGEVRIVRWACNLVDIPISNTHEYVLPPPLSCQRSQSGTCNQHWSHATMHKQLTSSDTPHTRSSAPSYPHDMCRTCLSELCVSQMPWPSSLPWAKQRVDQLMPQLPQQSTPPSIPSSGLPAQLTAVALYPRSPEHETTCSSRAQTRGWAAVLMDLRPLSVVVRWDTMGVDKAS